MSNKNKNAVEETLPKSYDKLSDIEFIAYADYLSSPYYKNYMDARGQSILQNSPSYIDVRAASANAPARVEAAGYRRKKGVLVFIALFMLLLIAVTALSYIGTIVPEYVSSFVKTEGTATTHIGLTDPIFGLIKNFVALDINSIFFNDCISTANADTKIASLIAFYGLPIAALIAVLLMIIIFFTAIAAAAKKGETKGFVAKKAKFGFLSLLLFIVSLFIAACGIVWNDSSLTEIVGFFTQTTKIYAGYGLYALVGLSLISMIFNWCAYKKVKNTRK